MFSIANKQVKTWLIDPEFVEKEKKADRMEDIATFFLNNAIDTFAISKDFSLLKKNLKLLFDGYDEYLNRFDLSIDYLYESKELLAFKFHLGLNSLLEALFTIKNDPSNLDRIKNCLSLTSYLWSKEVF